MSEPATVAVEGATASVIADAPVTIGVLLAALPIRIRIEAQANLVDPLELAPER